MSRKCRPFYGEKIREKILKLFGFLTMQAFWKGSGREKRTRETTKGEKHKSAKTIF